MKITFREVPQLSRFGPNHDQARIPMADAAVGCELLRMIEQRLDREAGELLGRALVAPLRSSSAGDQVAAALLIDVFHRTAETLQLPDLAIRFSEWVDVARLGYVAQLWSHFPTLGELLAAATQYIPVENSGLAVSVDRDRSDVWLNYVLDPRLSGHEEQFMEAALAVGVKAIRTLFGRSWNPRQVRFRHVPAASYSRLYEYFRAPVVSSADTYSIRFSADDLRLRRATRDDTVGAIIKEFLDERMRRLASSFRDDVERLVARRLRDGEDATLTAIAAVLAMGHRTLQRRLHDAGTDFASVLADARATIVLSFLASAGDRPISKLTELLGYSAPSAVCRFVRFRFGCDARELRNRLLDGSGDYLAGAERAS